MSSAGALTATDLAGVVGRLAHERGALLLCTDYDGTIAPIAATPDEAHALPGAIRALTMLTAAGMDVPADGRPAVRVAVVTSRSCADIASRLHLGPEVVLVGSAGLERWYQGHVELDPDVIPWLPAIAEATGLLATELGAGRVAGSSIERKQCGVVIHTRGAHSATIDAEALTLGQEVAARTGLDLLVGKRAVELRPPLGIDKGHAIRAMHRGTAADGAVVAAGDDLPDIPMLTAAVGLGGIAVAVADVETPDQVRAAGTVAVDGPWQWAQILGELSVAVTARG